MAVTEITSTGWLGRIGNSIKGVLFGIVLVLGSLVLTYCNEKNAVADIQANKELASKVVTVSAAEINPDMEGSLVHMNGMAATEDRVKQEAFGIDENAIRLSWDSKIYQWVEDEDTETKKKVGGGEETVTTYSYQKKWVDAPVDSSRFKERGHDNQGKKRFASGSSEARTVTLGAFKLAPGMISQMKWSEPYPLKSLPADLEETGVLADGVYHTGLPDQPKIGDERVTFTITRADEVTVVGVQKEDSFGTFKAQNGKQKLLLYRGILTAEEVVEEEKKKAMFLRWGLRGLGVFLMFFGFTLFIKPLSVLADVIPVLGNLVGTIGALISFLLALGISSFVIALCWLAVRPMIGIPLLVIGVGCFAFLLAKFIKGKKQVELMPPPPPPPGVV